MDEGEISFADTESIEEAVYQAVGAASMCWENVAGAGVFDDKGATAVAQALYAHIQERWSISAAELARMTPDEPPRDKCGHIRHAIAATGRLGLRIFDDEPFRNRWEPCTDQPSAEPLPSPKES